MGHVAQLRYLYEFITKKTSFQDMNPAQSLVNAPNLCLANIGEEYVVYAPDGSNINLNLSGATKQFSAEWLNPRTGVYQGLATITGGSEQVLSTPDTKDWVLHLTAVAMELSDFEPDHSLGTDIDGRTGIQSPKVMRRGTDEYLIYHPNAAADGKEARVDISRNARLRLDLKAAHGLFSVEWYRAEDGTICDGGVSQGGKEIELASPWTGHDVVIHLVKVSDS